MPSICSGSSTVPSGLIVRSESTSAPWGTETSAISPTSLRSSTFWMVWIRSTIEPSGNAWIAAASSTYAAEASSLPRAAS